MKPFVSVIIPCYNAAAYLREAILSVAGQSYAPLECIVVDDGSRDDSLSVANGIATQDLQLKVFSKPNGGRAAALNYGLKQVNPAAELVVFFDADDVLHPDFVSRNVAILLANPEIVSSATQARQFEKTVEDSKPLHRSRFTIGRLGPRDLPLPERATPFYTFFCCTGQGPWAMHRLSAIRKSGGLEESLNQGAIHGNEDTDLFCKMALQGRVEYLPEALYDKREHTTNVTKTRDMGYDRFREIWDAKLLEMAKERPELRLLLSYYYKVHCPLRDLKVAQVAVKDFRRLPNIKNLVRVFELLSHGVPRLLVGYPWFLLIFNTRRKSLRGWI